MSVWTERHAREAVDVWGVHPKSTLKLAARWFSDKNLNFSITQRLRLSTPIQTSRMCVSYTLHINTPDSGTLCIICLRLNYFITQSSASRSASDDMSDYFEMLLHLWAHQPAQAALRLLEKVYIHKMGSDSNIPEDTLTAQDSFRSSRWLELCQSGTDRFTAVNDKWREWQEVQIYGSSHTPFLGEWRWRFCFRCRSFYSLLFLIVTLVIINEISDNIWRRLKPWKMNTLTFSNLSLSSTGADLKFLTFISKSLRETKAPPSVKVLDSCIVGRKHNQGMN